MCAEASMMQMVLWFTIGLTLNFAAAQVLPDEIDLCSERPGHYPNGEHFPSSGMSSIVYVTNTSIAAKQKCLMRFTTCRSCKFVVRALEPFDFPNCHWTVMFNNYSGDCAPGCTYLHLFDPDYRNETSKSFIRAPWTHDYYGESSTLYVVMCSSHSLVKNIHVKLQLRSEEKRISISGSSVDQQPGMYRVVKSPFFPSPYTQNDELYLYYFRAINKSEYIELVFDDWHVSPASTLYFSHGDLEGPVDGKKPRPIVISNSNVLSFQFKTGINNIPGSFRNYMGFKVTYRFFKERSSAYRAQTNCGAYILDSSGGTIKFNPSSSPGSYFDCVWVVKTMAEYSSVYVKVITFYSSRAYYSSSGGNTLEIRGGLTSLGPLRESLTPSSVDDASSKGYEEKTGFYIRLRGRYRDASDVVLAFTSFYYGQCRTGDFKCNNRKCIPARLRCDGKDHCGDNSDERSSLCDSSQDWQDHYSYTISIGVIIPMVVSIFLIIVICLLVIFIRRCRKLSQQARSGSRSPINTVSGNVARRNRRRNRGRINITIEQDSPPSYDEVIRTTPVGYLNMAFMWSQGDVSMTQPPTYEEAMTPTTVTSPGFGSESGIHNLSSSSSSSDHSHNFPLHQSVSSSSSGDSVPPLRQPNDSTSSDNSSFDHRYEGSVGPRGVQDRSHGEVRRSENQQQSMPRPIHPGKPVEDEFIENPVSTVSLQDKRDKQRQNGVAPEGVNNPPVAMETSESGATASPTSSRQTLLQQTAQSPEQSSSPRNPNVAPSTERESPGAPQPRPRGPPTMYRRQRGHGHRVRERRRSQEDRERAQDCVPYPRGNRPLHQPQPRPQSEPRNYQRSDEEGRVGSRGRRRDRDARMGVHNEERNPHPPRSPRREYQENDTYSRGENSYPPAHSDQERSDAPRGTQNVYMSLCLNREAEDDQDIFV